MQNSARIVGSPSYVMASVCTDCSQRQWVRRTVVENGKIKSKAWCLRCCAFTGLKQSQVDEWGQIHASATRNSKFGEEIEGVDMGRKGRVHSYKTPQIQFWHDFAHSDEYRYTDKIHTLKSIVVSNISKNLPDLVISDAIATLARVKDCDDHKALEWLTLLIGECAEMLRSNATFVPTGKEDNPERTRKIHLNHLVVMFRVSQTTFYPRKNADGRRVKPPLLRLVEEVDLIVSNFDNCIYK